MTNNDSQRNFKICLKIKLKRVKKGLSQEELSAAAGLSKNGLGRIERAEVSPTIKSIEKIAEALDIDFMELIDITKMEL